MRARVDRFLNQFVSKKLTVFIVGTVFVVIGKIMPENWVNISMVYIGSQAAIDAIVKLRGSN